jgi:hypothetical protein
MLRQPERKLARLSAITEFYCRTKKRRLTVGDCLERYVDANAFEKRKSACWRCFQGKRTRVDFAHETEND